MSKIAKSFDPLMPRPLDARLSVADQAAREATSHKYRGMKVYQEDTEAYYKLVKTVPGDIDDPTNRVIDAGGSGGITYHNITHADLLLGIANSTFVKGDYYTVTDFETVQQMVTMEVLTHTRESLTVQALDVNVLSKNATSLDFPTDIIEYDPSKEDFTEETYGYRDYGTSYDDIVFSNFGTNTVDINIVLGDMYTILLDTDAGDSYSYDQTGLGVDFNLTVVGSVTTIEFLDGAIDLLSGDCYLEINSYVILGSTKGRIIKRVDTLNNNTFNYDWRTIQGKMFSCDLSLYTSWTANTRFVAGSVVTYAGSLYMCVAGASYSATFPFSDFETIFAGPGLATRRFTAMGDGFGGIDNSLLFLINPTASLYQNTFYNGFNCNIVSTNTLNYSVFRGFNINSTVVSEGCSFGSLTKCNINGSNIHTEPLSNTNIGYVNNSFLKGGSAGDSNISSIRNSYILDLGLSYVGEISNSFIKSLYNSKIGDLTYSYIKKIEAGSDIRVATGLCGNDCIGNTIHSATNMCFLQGTDNNTYLSVYNATIGMRVNNSYYTGEIISSSPNVVTVDGTPYAINALVGKYVTSDEGVFGIILSNTVSSITFLPIWSDSITMNTGHFVMIFDPVAVNCSNNIIDRIEYSSFGGCMNTKFGKITTSSAYGFDSCDIGAIGNSVCSSPISNCIIARIYGSSIYGTTNNLFNGSTIGIIESSILYGEVGISGCNISSIRSCELYLTTGSNFYDSSIGSLFVISAGAKGAPIQTSITSCNLGHLINGFLGVGSGIYGCNIAKLDLVGATIDYTFAGVSGSLILYKDMSAVPNIDTEDTKLVYNAVSGGSNKLFVSQYDYATETQTITVV